MIYFLCILSILKENKMKDFFNTLSPEKAGIKSENVIAFMDGLERFGINLHSFILMKGNDIFAEGYRKPFKKDELHRMYSVSKTFAAMAIGILIGDGVVDINAPIIKYFPEYDKEDVHPNIRNMTIEHILKMTTCFPYGSTYSAVASPDKVPDWLDTFFCCKTTHPSGTIYNYDSSASYMLAVLVERITGKPFMELLKDRALCKIGGSKDMRCLKAPGGHSWASSAVLCSTRDLARLARLTMLKGEWDGEQLLPRDFVEKATTSQVDDDQTGFPDAFHGRGYGYQIWMTMEGSYSFIGMGEQLAVCMPDKDLLFVCTSDHQGLEGIARQTIYIELMHHIKDNLCECSLDENGDAYKKLLHKCENLEYPLYKGAHHSDVFDKYNGKTFILNENTMGISEICFTVDNDGNGRIDYINTNGSKTVKFGIGKAVIDVFPEDSYSGDTLGVPSGRNFRSIASGAFTDERTLHIKCDVIDDYFGNLNIIAIFDNDVLSLYMKPNAQMFLGEYRGFTSGKLK